MYKVSLRVWKDSTRSDYDFKEFFIKDLSKLASFVQQYDFKSISVEPIVFVD